MFLKFQDLEPIQKEHMRNGEGHVILRKWETEDKMIAQITIPTNCSIGVHTHEEDEEIIYVIQGSGICYVDGKENPLQAGMVNYCMKHENHSIKNTNPEDLVLFAVINKKIL